MMTPNGIECSFPFFQRGETSLRDNNVFGGTLLALAGLSQLKLGTFRKICLVPKKPHLEPSLAKTLSRLTCMLRRAFQQRQSALCTHEIDTASHTQCEHLWLKLETAHSREVWQACIHLKGQLDRKNPKT